MSKVIQISKASTELSKSQKEFNRLVKKIEKIEKEIVDYRAGLSEIQLKVGKELAPVQKVYYEQRAELVRCFDRAYDSGELKKPELKKLKHLIEDIAFDVIENGGIEALIPIHDKHSEQSYDEFVEEGNDQQAEQVKRMFEMFGIKFEEELDFKDPEKLQAQLAQKMAEQQASFEEQHRQNAERRAARPKTQKQLEREQKKELEARSLTKSVRAIYMDLVKAFHPDREPDEAERERKTLIMQRITEAYEKNDLLGLLRLQMELERIDQSNIENLAEGHLKNYNKLLKEQVKDLEAEMEDLQTQAASMSGQRPFYVTTIWGLKMALDQDIAKYKQIAKNIKKDIKAFQDLAILKVFLKQYKIPKAQKNDNESLFEILMR